ncbi:MAG: hypothetical protein BGO43_14865 [Gammaproteobacteria bacterium 39-13]|nr:EAL domain-containing protein [Gammaproteobacteria bacterium]OJV95766.1 MAG: hypothetical protein BGO43_14865 [Gammaproteobacteria bacterium 39-13]
MNHRNFLSVFILSTIGAMLSFAITLYFSWIWTEQIQYKELSRLADLTVHRTHVLFQESYQVMKSFEAMSFTPCSKEHIALMRQANSHLHAFDEVEYVENGIVKCSAYELTDNKLQIPSSRHALSNGLEIIFNMQRLKIEDYDEIALRYNNYIILIDPMRLTDIIVDSYIKIAVVTRDGHILSTLNNPDLSLVKNLLKNNNVFMQHNELVAISKMPDLSAVVMQSRRSLVNRWYDELILFFPFSLLMTTLVAVIIVWALRRRLSTLGELKTAVTRHEFIVHYQPLIELKTGACVGVEALMRWQRPDGTVIPPDSFVSVAEENNLIQAITDQVIAIIVNDFRDLLSTDRQLHVAINIVANDLKTGRILKVIKEAISNTDIHPNQIWLEVTEREFMDVHAAKQSIKEAHDLGHSIAIDDFGTGYSTLSYLQELSLDILKIDKIFVRSLNMGATTSVVASEIIRMAKALKMKIVAEGVETQAQVDYLETYDVEYGQGWLFAKAMPIKEFIDFYKRNKLLIFQMKKNFSRDDLR